MKDDEIRQKVFEENYSSIEGPLCDDLRKAGYMTLDENGKKTTNGAKVQFKAFDQDNYLATKKERYKGYAPDHKRLDDSDENDEDEFTQLENFQYTQYKTMRSVDSAIRPVLVGYDAINLHKDEPYIIRRPINGGNLNVVPLKPEKGEDDPMDDS